MTFDPSLPAAGSPLQSQVVRDQFNGLKDLLDALAAGTVTAVVVDVVNTISPGNPATVGATVIGNTLHLTFTIPQGNDGAQGAPGEVSAQQLADGLAATLASATANSSANTNAISTLDTPFADPDAEALRAKCNEMLLALRR